MLSRLQSFISYIRNLRFASLLYAVVLVLTAIAILSYAFLTRKPLEIPDGDASFLSPECVAYEKEITTLRRELEDTDKRKSGPYTEAQSATAEKLLAAYDKWLGNCANGVKLDRYFDTVRVRYETTRAENTAANVDAADKAGLAAIENGDYASARKYFSLALSAQRQINERFPSSNQADVNRAVVIERRLMDATYKPILMPYLSLKSEGEAAFDKADYETARAKYASLIREIDRIAVDIPQDYMSFVEPKRTSERRLLEAAARIKGRDLDKAIAGAERAVEAKDWKTAETLYADVNIIQRTISQNYPQTTLAGANRTNALEKSRQDNLSKEYLYEFDELLRNIGHAVKAGDGGRLHGYIVRADSRVAELDQKYPVSDAIKDERVTKLKFLTSHQYELIDIQETMAAHVLKITGNTEWRMLDREVWQLLYTRLMGSNPSARKADTLPVEGVTMEEAREFARRLSWIMADEVKVPDLETYMVQMDKPDLNFIRKYAWNSVTSPTRETQLVATSKADAHGYYDLFGNASEWAEPTYAAGSVAFVIGGSARDNPTRMSEIPQEQHKVSERVRNAGFRVMIRLSK